MFSRFHQIILFLQVLFFVGPLWAVSLPDIIEAVKPSIVGVGTYQATRQPRSQLQGTGFVVGDGHHVVTNAHVIDFELDVFAQEIRVAYLGSGPKPEMRKIEVVAQDKVHDLVLLKLDGPALPAMKLGNSDVVREGECYLFTGFPIGAVLGLYPATHQAMISAITPGTSPVPQAGQLSAVQIRRLSETFTVFQLDTTAFPGNSGSPLFNSETGEVIGVINKVFVQQSKEYILENPSGISYAIPISFARALVNDAGIVEK